MPEQMPVENEPDSATQSQSDKPVWLYYLIMFSIATIPLIIVGWYALSKLDGLSEQYVARYAMAFMSDEEKERIYADLTRQVAGVYDAVPEPLVGRVLQRNIKKEQKGAEIVSNSAGMRSARPYAKKRKNKYRIICLGDSIVFGYAGKEKDRLGDQIEEILAATGTTFNGKTIEVYSLAIPSWNTVNEVSYLSSRISEYDPDLTLVLAVANDLGDTRGVMGVGVSTRLFSPQHRDLGSGVFSHNIPRSFGVKTFNLMGDDLGPESRDRWETAFSALKRLETLLKKKNSRMMLGVMDGYPLFTELCKSYHVQAGLQSPIIVTTAFLEDNKLPHDNHPNRDGHRIMAIHFLHILADLGWLPVRVEDLPPLDPRIERKTDNAPKAERIRALKEEKIEKFLDEDIVFDQLDEGNVVAFLGGIYPGSYKDMLHHYPFGSLKSGFLLKRRKGAKKLLLEIEVPPFVELYPFKLQMRLNGVVAAELALDNESEAGRHRLEGAIPETEDFPSTIEVILRTDSYWTTISNPIMKSYRLISVRQL